jgi:hypothetical protein
LNHLETYESQWEGGHPIYEMENKKWLKPPSRLYMILINIKKG